MFFFIKLITIFIGSGLATYFAYLVSKEASKVPKLILNSKQYKDFKDFKESLKVKKQAKISSKSGFYEVLFPQDQSIKLFSSHKGMKILN